MYPRDVKVIYKIYKMGLEFVEPSPVTPEGKSLADRLFPASYWEEEASNLYGLLFPTFYDSAMGAMDTGVSQLMEILAPNQIAPSFGSDIVSPLASEYARQASFNVAWGVTKTSERYLQGAISEWINSGEPLDNLKAELGKYWSPSRASAIAVTEVTRVFSEANQLIWRESGLVAGKVWQTAFDELVCPICRPLNKKKIGLGDGFTTEADLFGLQGPPAHVNCRCWLKPTNSLADTIPVLPSKPTQYSPQGVPLGRAYNYPTRGKLYDIAKGALNEIDNIHGDGDLTNIPIKWTSSKKRRGSFRYSWGNKPVHIDVARGIEQGQGMLTLAHEIGHHLDLEALGMAGAFESSVAAGELAGVFEAILASPEYLQLVDMMANPKAYAKTYTYMVGEVEKSYTVPPDLSHTRYLANENELWARSYAQYIAEKSGNTDMLEALESELGSDYPRQWSKESFKPIMEAIDKYFLSKGWME